jgi:hypothetical protein
MIFKNKKLITYSIGLFIFLSVILTWVIYKKNFSEKARLEYCADINIITDWLTGKVPKSNFTELSGNEKQGISMRPLKEKLLYPLYNKVWDECVNELKNSPIKFYEKNSTEFRFRNFFK